MCAVISLALLFISAISGNPNLAIASGLFAIGAEIAAYTHKKFG